MEGNSEGGEAKQGGSSPQRRMKRFLVFSTPRNVCNLGRSILASNRPGPVRGRGSVAAVAAGAEGARSEWPAPDGRPAGGGRVAQWRLWREPLAPGGEWRLRVPCAGASPEPRTLGQTGAAAARRATQTLARRAGGHLPPRPRGRAARVERSNRIRRGHGPRQRGIGRAHS